jgi:hypothetical protein
MAKPQISSRVDDHVKEELTEYAESGDMTEAAAVRHLVRRGLDAEEGQLVADGGAVQEQLGAIQRQQRASNALSALLIGSVLFLVLFARGSLRSAEIIGGGLALAAGLGASVWYSSRGDR